MPTIDSFNLYDPSTGQYNELKVATKITKIDNTVTLLADSSFVNIGITEFNPVEDILDVVKNTTVINEGTGEDEYILNGANLRIENPNGLWTSGTKFYFRVFKNVDKDTLPTTDGGLLTNDSVAKVKLAVELREQIDSNTSQLAEVAIKQVVNLNEILQNTENGKKYKLDYNASVDSIVTLSNKNNIYIQFVNGGIIQWENTLNWLNKEYTNGAWKYYVKDAFVLDGLTDCTIDALNFVQDKVNASIKTWNGLVLRNCKNVTITNCTIDGFDWCGIAVESTCTDCKILDNKVYRCRFGIYDKGVNSEIKRNDVSNKYSESQEYISNGNVWVASTPTYDSKYYDGIMAYGTNSKYEDNKCKDNGQSGIYSSQCTNCSFINNELKDNYNVGLDLGTVTGTSEILNALILGNKIRNNANNDLNLTGVDYSVCSNNQIEVTKEGKYGIILTGSSSNNTIMGNKIKHNGIDVNSRGISVASSCQNNKVLLNDVIAPTPYSIGGTTNVLFKEDSSSFKNILNIDLTSKTGYDGRAILQLLASSDNTIAQILANKPIKFTDLSGNVINITAAQLAGSSLQVTGLGFFSDAASIRLPRTEQLSEGCLWYDATTHQIKYRDNATTKTVTAI